MTSKKEKQRIEKWAEKSRSLHRIQEQIKGDYLKDMCRIDELHELNSEKLH
jgi:hypothetical protein